MALRNRPMNREEIEEVLDYISHYSRPLHIEDGVITGSRRAQLPRSGILLFDEAPTPGAHYHLSEGAVTFISDPPPPSTQSGALPERPITVERIVEAMESIGSPPEPPPFTFPSLQIPSPSQQHENLVHDSKVHYTTLEESRRNFNWAIESLGEPLYVGMEWEPQATLLNYPKLQVHVEASNLFPFSTQDNRRVHITLPKALRFYTDGLLDTLEIRLNSCPPSKMQHAINQATMQLETLCKIIATDYGPCALFLPANDPKRKICTKHYHVSWEVKDIRLMDSYHSVLIRSECYGKLYTKQLKDNEIRLHINVPYEFTKYDDLEYAWFGALYDIDYSLKPRLLCYSHTGENVVSMSKLT